MKEGQYKIIKHQEDVSKAFNNMPFACRLIASNSELISRIRDLERQKIRLKKNYDTEIDFINMKISHYEQSIKPQISEINENQ